MARIAGREEALYTWGKIAYRTAIQKLKNSIPTSAANFANAASKLKRGI